jgi:hypothetical protein
MLFWAGTPLWIPPNSAKPIQGKSRKKAWIFLVLFVQIGTFQWVAADPNKILLLAPPFAIEALRGAFDPDKLT